MYGELLRENRLFEQQLRRADQHRGSSDDYVRRVNRLLGPERVRDPAKRKQLAAHAAKLCSDERLLLHVAQELQQSGGGAPGVDGVGPGELERVHLFSIARQLRDQLRSGRYHPAPLRRVSIRKPDGGARNLEIPTVQDRIVGKACAKILARFFEPEFDARSYGFRPSRNRLQALAEAISVTNHEDRQHWIVDDIIKAFEHVPLERLWQVIHKRLPGGEAFIQQIKTAIGSDRKRGLPTGHPLSPLLLNLYLDHTLDRWWRKEYPTVPLLRTADDLLVLSQSEDEARRVYPDLVKRLNAAGMQMHGAERLPVEHVRRTAVEYLGFRVRHEADDWSITLSANWQQRLERRLRRLPGPPDGLAETRHVIEALIGQCGPAYAQRIEVLDFIAQRLSQRGLQAAYDSNRLQQHWQAGWMRWQALRQRQPAGTAE